MPKRNACKDAEMYRNDKKKVVGNNLIVNTIKGSSNWRFVFSDCLYIKNKVKKNDLKIWLKNVVAIGINRNSSAISENYAR